MKLSLLSHCLFVVVTILSLSPSTEAETLKLGLLACLTTECAEWGANTAKGVQLAVSEINARGGILGKTLEVISEDTSEASGGGKAVSAFQKLELDNSVRFFIGPTWSEAGMNLVPLIKKRNDIVIISPSLGVATFNEAAENIFNLWPHDSTATATLAHAAWDHGWRRVSILGSQKVWDTQQAESFSRAFESLGGKIVSREEPEPSIRDLRSIALRILKAKPDAVFFATFHHAGIGAKAFQELQYSGGKLAVLIDEARIAEAQGGLDGAIFARYGDPTENFTKSYQKKFGTKPGITADTAYDTVYAYARAIESAQSLEPAKVITALKALDFQGASGAIRFDKLGGIIKTPDLFRIHGKEFVKVPQ